MKKFKNLLASLTNTYESNAFYRISKIQFCQDSNLHHIVVQVVGKNIWNQYEARILYQDKTMLSNFNAIDASTITELALKDACKPEKNIMETGGKLTLVSHSIRAENGMPFLTIKDENSLIHLEDNIDKIAKNKNIISRLAPAAAFKVGYLYGCFVTEKIFNSLKKLTLRELQ